MSRLLGNSIHYLHKAGVFIAIVTTIIVPKTYLNYILTAWLGMVLTNWLYGKCIVTKVEMFLTGEKKTIVDGCLNSLGFEISNKNRKNITLITGTTMLLVCGVRLYYD